MESDLYRRRNIRRGGSSLTLVEKEGKERVADSFQGVSPFLLSSEPLVLELPEADERK